jgi:Zn finger protein HypA/HybF involved in hydrogenase expression
MHELSITMNILSIVEEECLKAGCGRVDEVVISIRDLSGVERTSLETCLHVATRLLQKLDRDRNC